MRKKMKRMQNIWLFNVLFFMAISAFGPTLFFRTTASCVVLILFVFYIAIYAYLNRIDRK